MPVDLWFNNGFVLEYGFVWHAFNEQVVYLPITPGKNYTVVTGFLAPNWGLLQIARDQGTLRIFCTQADTNVEWICIGRI